MTRTIGAAIGVVLVLLFFASLGASYGHAREQGPQRSAVTARR
jgi:hypothetical protein